jgi:type III pantothenate kinase
MTPNVVADVGNSRVKWGVCGPDGIARMTSLPPEPAAWEAERARLGAGRLRWAIASVQPAWSERLIAWLRERGDEARRIQHADLRLTVNVEAPGRVGIDRLLNAVAAASRLEAGEPAAVVSAGSAVTVDYLDERHVFQGGVIFPGPALMAKALHGFTALLPEVEVQPPLPEPPGKDTVPAIQLGILAAVTGGVESVLAGYYRLAGMRMIRRFFTGGHARLLTEALPWHAGCLWPEMTLHGILLAAQGME